MFCYNCGKKINDNDCFCTYCGTKVKETKSNTKEDYSSVETDKNFSDSLQCNNEEKASKNNQGSKKIGWISLMAITIIILWFISYYSGPKRESEILKDIPAKYCTISVDGQDIILKASKIDIEKRQTTTDTLDIIYCTITFENADYQASGDFYLEYEHYDKGGWILEEISRRNSNKLSITPKNGVPKTIINEYLTHRKIKDYDIVKNKKNSYNNRYFVSCDINGNATIENSKETIPYKGTMELIYEFTTYGSNSCSWHFITCSYDINPTETISVDIASATANKKYFSAAYSSDVHNADNHKHTFTFSVNESHKYCDISGTLVLEYQFLIDENNYPYWKLSEGETTNIITDWNKIIGNWTAEFNDGAKKITLCLGIKSIYSNVVFASKEILFSNCKYIYQPANKNSHMIYTINDDDSFYKVLNDGSIQFDIKDDDTEWLITIEYDSAIAFFQMNTASASLTALTKK